MLLIYMRMSAFAKEKKNKTRLFTAMTAQESLKINWWPLLPCGTGMEED